MKAFILSLCLAFIAGASFSNNIHKPVRNPESIPDDTVKLLYDGTHVYYQKVIKVDTITEDNIYLRTIEFMAAQNIQQNYGDQEEGKLIFTTSQDLNISGYVPTIFSVQFSIILDMKNGRYRYTINNAVFFYDNNRYTLNDINTFLHPTSDSRQSKYNYAFGRTMLASFDKYLITLLGELHENIINKAVTSSSKF